MALISLAAQKICLGAIMIAFGWTQLSLEGRLDHTNQKVRLRHHLDGTLAERLTVTFPDGRTYYGYFSISNLLRPGQQPPPLPAPPLHGGRQGPIPYYHVLERTFEGSDGSTLACSFAYDAASGPQGHGRCTSSRQETLSVVWKR